jgi:steroid 5-alpha reductase family enzyme
MLGILIGASLGISLTISFGSWILSLIFKDSSIADIFWGTYFIFIALILYFLQSGPDSVQTIYLLLIIIWGLRLAIHIGLRKVNKPEDKRYAAWRIKWGSNFQARNLVQNYLLQGMLAATISLPTFFIFYLPQNNEFNWLKIIGLILFGIGFSFEVISDFQLSRFLKNGTKTGSIMTKGLWKYSRHPNYFGEIVLWWGLWIISLSSRLSLIGVIGPILISVLILFVSGVPLLEKHYEHNKNYQEYKRVTPPLVPFLKNRNEN